MNIYYRLPHITAISHILSSLTTSNINSSENKIRAAGRGVQKNYVGISSISALVEDVPHQNIVARPAIS